MIGTDTQPLTQTEWTEKDFEKGERIARSLGYEQTAYKGYDWKDA